MMYVAHIITLLPKQVAYSLSCGIFYLISFTADELDMFLYSWLLPMPSLFGMLIQLIALSH